MYISYYHKKNYFLKKNPKYAYKIIQIASKLLTAFW